MTKMDAERTRHAARLDDLWTALEAEMKSGQVSALEAADRGLEILDQRAKLLGLYAPERVTIVDDETGKGSPAPDPAIIEAIRKLKARQASGDT